MITGCCRCLQDVDMHGVFMVPAFMDAYQHVDVYTRN